MQFYQICCHKEKIQKHPKEERVQNKLASTFRQRKVSHSLKASSITSTPTPKSLTLFTLSPFFLTPHLRKSQLFEKLMEVVAAPCLHTSADGCGAGVVSKVELSVIG